MGLRSMVPTEASRSPIQNPPNYPLSQQSPIPKCDSKQNPTSKGSLQNNICIFHPLTTASLN